MKLAVLSDIHGNLPALSAVLDDIAQRVGEWEVEAFGIGEFKDRFGLSYSLFAFPHNDRYISRDFFRNTEGVFDLTFGTCGIAKDPIATNLQRINFERSLRPASRIVVRQLIKKAIFRHGGKARLKRDRAI